MLLLVDGFFSLQTAAWGGSPFGPLRPALFQALREAGIRTSQGIPPLSSRQPACLPRAKLGQAKIL